MNYEKSCLLCKNEHYIAYCPKYQQKTIKQRLELVSAKGFCFNCLGHHRASNCQSTKRCVKCGKRHHSTLRKAPASCEKKSSTDVQPQSLSLADVTASRVRLTTEETTKVVHHVQPETFDNPNSVVLLATTQVKVINQHEEALPTRVLLTQAIVGDRITKSYISILNLINYEARRVYIYFPVNMLRLRAKAFVLY